MIGAVSRYVDALYNRLGKHFATSQRHQVTFLASVATDAVMG